MLITQGIVRKLVWENGSFHVRRGREWFWENHQKSGLICPWADGKPDNDMDTESDFVIATYRRGWDDVSPGGGGGGGEKFKKN